MSAPDDQTSAQPTEPTGPTERAGPEADRAERVRRLRREPPRLRRVEVRRAEALGPRLLRLTLTGDELDGLVIDQPAASVRLLLPSVGTTELVLPQWAGNEFLLPDGRRPILRTFTPRRLDARAVELDLDVVLHGGGAASSWAVAARPGDPAAISGPGRGYELDPGAPALLLAGDETALPAISQLLEALPAALPVQVHVEVARPDGRLDTLDQQAAARSGATTLAWYDLPEGAPPGDALAAAVKAAEIAPGERVWAAGEAAAVQRIRRHLFEERSMARAHTTVRGYWKHGRAGDTD
ncbi:MAG TPA: siderophore-interacting protein [Acidimicrobiales bacterium]|nr:siderophore-interacting protein [Acidimicrobiales bacterium]